MRITTPIVLAIAILVPSASRATPRWYLGEPPREYANFIVGRGAVARKGKALHEATEQATAAAMIDAASTITCRVSGETLHRISEKTRSAADTQIEEALLSQTRIQTDLQIMDMKTLAVEKDRSTVYTMVGISRNALCQSYRNRIEEAARGVKSDLELAEKIQATAPVRALEAYSSCISSLLSIKHDHNIYLFLKNWKSDLIGLIKGLPSEQDIEAQLLILSKKTPRRIPDIAEALLKPLLPSDRSETSFCFCALEFGSAGLVSEFGFGLTEMLANRLVTHTGWQQTWSSATADVVLYGSILESGSGLHVTLHMRDRKSRKESSSHVFVNEISCKTIGWAQIRPAQLDRVLEEKATIYDGIRATEDLKVDVLTDKNTGGAMVYRYGDKPNVRFRVSQPAYVRLFYVFADGTKILLLDNHRVGRGSINQWLPVPAALEVCEPSGTEQLLVQAATFKLPPVSIERRNMDGGFVQDIVKGTTGNAIGVARDIEVPKGAMFAEKPYQWTVLPND